MSTFLAEWLRDRRQANASEKSIYRGPSAGLAALLPSLLQSSGQSSTMAQRTHNVIAA
jgi:hypothetical protein